MLKIIGEHYYIDLDAIEKYVDMTVQTVDTTGKTETAINIIKYETVKLMLDVVLSENDESDDKLGLAASSDLSLPFKLAFNTLLNKKIINKY
ncbi:MAG: hypothetical protein K9I82_04120 [Chitinophagaceae bacterium]|jgi:hypothetical protein|nr:hypothetical protein [Chitinophagaceae bacterium]